MDEIFIQIDEFETLSNPRLYVSLARDTPYEIELELRGKISDSRNLCYSFHRDVGHLYTLIEILSNFTKKEPMEIVTLLNNGDITFAEEGNFVKNFGYGFSICGVYKEGEKCIKKPIKSSAWAKIISLTYYATSKSSLCERWGPQTNKATFIAGDEDYFEYSIKTKCHLCMACGTKFSQNTDLVRHKKICNLGKTKYIYKQQVFGNIPPPQQFLIDYDISYQINSNFISYDIETYQDDQKVQTLASIALTKSWSEEHIFLAREDDTRGSYIKLIRHFFETLNKLYEEFLTTFERSCDQVLSQFTELPPLSFNEEKRKRQAEHFIRKLYKLPIMGFNSRKIVYDIFVNHILLNM